MKEKLRERKKNMKTTTHFFLLPFASELSSTKKKKSPT